METDIPTQFFRNAWEDCEHPMACVSIDNIFIAVNSAFERMLGYSEAELIGRTWMEFTLQSDVGGDLASVRAVLDGKSTKYRMDKRYIHKRGHTIPVTIAVQRFPKDLMEPIMFFSVEAPIQHATQLELAELQKTNHTTFQSLIKRLDEIERKGIISVTNHQGDQWHNGDKTGHNKITNSDKMIKYLCGAVIVISICVAWFAYYVATSATNTIPVAPSNIGAEN